tara:strand:- start:8244 stop:9398 length:1155 start_codon:yes stop_codon:yes gene_type:complete
LPKLSLSHNFLLDQASSLVGLSNFGDTIHLEGLEQLCWSLNEEANLNDVGHASQISRITGILVNRLLLEEDFKNNSIAKEIIKPPIVIVGLPRTGSTLVHRLLSSDPDHTAMIWWEGRYPSRLKNEKKGNPQERISMAKQEVEIMIKASPDLMKIHPMDAMAPDEEILLLEHGFFSTVPESFMNVPTYSKWVESQDHTHSYEYLKKMLKYLQWQNDLRSNKSWVLKTPHHTAYVENIMKVFPGALFIQTHRNPLQTIPSYCSMVATLAEPLSDESQSKRLGQHWEKKLSRALNHCMDISRAFPDQFLNLNYEDLVSNPMEEINKIYDFIGKPFSHKASKAMKLWREENTKDKHGKHKYVSEDYGISNKEIKEDYAIYINRYIKD